MKPTPPVRSAFATLRPIATRWADNDLYGHVNNVVYYSFFDTLVNGWLIEEGLLEPHAGAVIGLVVATDCAYFAPVAFPEALEGGIRVDRIGTSSVTYGLGIFRAGEREAVAAGRFTHVYVGRDDRRALTLPAGWRAKLETLAPPEL